MGYGFFRDDDGPHEDRDYLGQFFGAIKLGVLLANICVFPFYLLGKFIGKAASASANPAPPNPQQNIPPPPRTSPPPFGQQQPPPPRQPPPSDPLEKYRIILGVTPDADKPEIKRRYHFLSHCYHPDKIPDENNGDAENEFKKLVEAYNVLYPLAPDGPQRARPHTGAQRAKSKPSEPSPKPHSEAPKQNHDTQARPKPDQPAPRQDAKPKSPSGDNPDWQKPKYF